MNHKDADILFSCTGKLGHETASAARKAARKGFLAVYRCRHCGLYHIAKSAPGAKDRAAKRRKA